jgi:hypothetical protein
VLAYSNGFEFFVTRLLRPDGPGFGRGSGPTPPGLRRDGPAVEQPMKVGVEFAGGSQVIGNVPSPHGNEAPPDGPSTTAGERMICRYPAASPVPACDFPAHLGAGANVGGLSFATQAVSGARGVARNDANTCCAQGDASVTAWPIPAN